MLTDREIIILIENLEKAKIKFKDYSYRIYRLDTIIDTLEYILNPEDKNYGCIIRGVCDENKR
jgi:hypothetical protein